MLDSFDYKEPSCAVCGGKEFYYPDAESPLGTIPVSSILGKLDAALNTNDLTEADRLLVYWENEARALRDDRGLVTVLSEQMGLYRKMNDEQRGLRSVYDGIALVDKLGLDDSSSGATVLLNAATTLKAFGRAAEAIPLYEKVGAVYSRSLDEYDVKNAGLCNNAALAYVDIGNKTEAERLYLRAIDILSHNASTENEIAITYINMAYLYEKDREEEAYSCVEKAISYLDSPSIERNGYHAFVCSKCVPAIEYFGYFLAKERLDERIKEIYERA